MNQSISKSHSMLEGKGALMSQEICYFLLDFSGSMGDRLGNSTKLKVMKDSVRGYIANRIKAILNGSKDRMGIGGFGFPVGHEVAQIHDPFSKNFDNLLSKLDNINGGGGTPMAEGIALATQVLGRTSEGFLRVVIVSDGQPDNKPRALEQITQAFTTYGIVFDTIGIGTPDPKDTPYGYGLDEEFMKKAAELGGGEYTHIDTPEQFLLKFVELERERELLLGTGIKLLGSGE